MNKKLIIAIVLILTGTALIAYDFLSSKHEEDIKNEAIHNYYSGKQIKTAEAEKTNYIAVLKIDKIDLKVGLVDKNNKYNNIEHNVQILADSDMPDSENGNVILAAHSGNSKISFFKHLDKLELNDEITIDYEGKTYFYRVSNIYNIKKTGKLELQDNVSSELTLITCRKNIKDMQFVIVAKLENIF